MSIIDRYFTREIFVPFMISLSALTGILFVQQLVEFVDLSLNKGADFISLLNIILYAFPSLLVITLPVSLLISSITVTNRLSMDNELTSLRTSGLSFYRIIRPFVVFSVVVGIITFSLASFARPFGGNTLKEVSFEILKKRINVVLEEGIFNDLFDQMMIYVEEMPNYSDLKGIFISDLRKPDDPVIITAREGIFITDEASSSVGFMLHDGNFYRKGKDPNSFQQIVFTKYFLSINLSSYIKNPGEKVKERLGLLALREKISKQGDGKLDSEDIQRLQQYYKTYALPLTTILFGILGPPLGTFTRRTVGNFGGFAIGSVIVVFYYFLTIVGDYFLAKNMVSPFFSAFFPNGILTAVSMYFLIKTDRQNLFHARRISHVPD